MKRARHRRRGRRGSLARTTVRWTISILMLWPQAGKRENEARSSECLLWERHSHPKILSACLVSTVWVKCAVLMFYVLVWDDALEKCILMHGSTIRRSSIILVLLYVEIFVLYSCQYMTNRKWKTIKFHNSVVFSEVSETSTLGWFGEEV